MVHQENMTGILLQLQLSHAHRLAPLANALAGALLTSAVHSEDKVHTLARSGVGLNSVGLYMSDGREFHFRGDSSDVRQADTHFDTIVVYDKYKKRGGHDRVLLARLRTVQNCFMFISELEAPLSQLNIKARAARNHYADLTDRAA